MIFQNKSHNNSHTSECDDNSYIQLLQLASVLTVVVVLAVYSRLTGRVIGRCCTDNGRAKAQW